MLAELPVKSGLRSYGGLRKKLRKYLDISENFRTFVE